MHKGYEELLEQLKKTRHRGILVGRDDLVASAHPVVHDQAETGRDVHGMLRIRQRPTLPQWN